MVTHDLWVIYYVTKYEKYDLWHSISINRYERLFISCLDDDKYDNAIKNDDVIVNYYVTTVKPLFWVSDDHIGCQTSTNDLDIIYRSQQSDDS